MILIRNISKTLLNKLLFNNFSLTIQKTDRIGLVGPNGSGKSTLLKMLSGIEYPDLGDILLEKEHLGFLEQTLSDEEKQSSLQEFFQGFKLPEVQRILQELNAPNNLDLILSDLSGGEQTKMALAKVLLDKPTSLLLDEPTNHLETPAVNWLTEFLSGYRGPVLAVSHDRKFLNKFANKILEIDPVQHVIHTYQGNYDDFKVQQKTRMEKWQMNYEVQQKEMRRMQDFIKEKQRQASQFPDPAKGRQIRQMEKRLQREILNQQIERPKSTLKITNAHLEGKGASSKLILRAKDLHYTLNEKTIFQNVNCSIHGTDRVSLSGPNGSGKTTFVKLSLGQLTAFSGTVKLGENVRAGYFDQTHEELPQEKSLLDFALGLPPHGDDRGFLARYGFAGLHVNRKISSLSQGEQVRLIVAHLLLEKYDLLILDEPTNHLDIESREVIEKAIREYNGAILVISHDQYFLEQIGITKEWTIQNYTIKEQLK